jgi:hypothetical protein
MVAGIAETHFQEIRGDQNTTYQVHWKEANLLMAS